MAPSLLQSSFFNSICSNKKTAPLPQIQKTPQKQKDETTHWKSAKDPKSGRIYYYHMLTKKTTWAKPSELTSPEERRLDALKEHQKREFFSSMESNVRRNIELGLVPGMVHPKKKNTNKVQFVSPTSPEMLVKEIDRSMVHLSLQELQKLPKPSLTKRNTCGTLYVESTMASPDKDKTIHCVCSVVLSYILSSPSKTVRSNNPYHVFNDEFSITNIPSLDDITDFYKSIFYKAQMESDCIIMSLIYIDRLMTKTNNRLRPCRNNWKSLLFSCMILSSKVWDDLSMWNADFSQSCEDSYFTLQRINQLEISILNFLNYSVKVTAKEYAIYYFKLRELEFDGSEDNLLDVEGAKKLEKCSATFQENIKPMPLRRRCKSEGQDKLILSPKSPRANLEQVVHM